MKIHATIIVSTILVLAASAQRDQNDIDDFLNNDSKNGDDPDPTNVGNVCSDVRASNYVGDGNTLSATVDDSLCLYQIMSVEAGKWTSMPEYCAENGFDWNNDEMTDCYDAAPKHVPPHNRDFSVENCSDPRMCSNPLNIEVLNTMVELLSFTIGDDSLSASIVFAAKWKDPRLFSTLVRDVTEVWTPDFAVSATLTERDKLPLPVVSENRQILDQRIYMSPAYCTAEEAKIQVDGQDLGCCVSGDSCPGTLEQFASFVDCPSVDECWVQMSQRIDVEYRIGNGLDVSEFPFDNHDVELAMYMVNPFQSTDNEWWIQNQPVAPKVIYKDYMSDIPTTEGSMLYSLQNIDIAGWTLEYRLNEKNSTSLSYLMNNAQYDQVLARSHKYGVGGLTVNLTFNRWSSIVSRYNLFPMALIGVMCALTLLIDDDAIEQISVRVGFGALAIFVALEPRSLQLISVAGSEKQITIVDEVSILTICLGGMVMFCALLSYSWWRYLDADTNKEWTCWKVRSMDRFNGITLCLVYIYIFVLLIVIPQSTTGSIIWAIVAAIVGLILWFVCMMYVYKWASKARITPMSTEETDSKTNCLPRGTMSESQAYRSAFASLSRL
eukprot:CFRG1847T1